MVFSGDKREFRQMAQNVCPHGNSLGDFDAASNASQQTEQSITFLKAILLCNKILLSREKVGGFTHNQICDRNLIGVMLQQFFKN